MGLKVNKGAARHPSRRAIGQTPDPRCVSAEGTPAADATHTAPAGIRVVNKAEKHTGCQVTTVRLGSEVEVGARDGWLCFWLAGREVRVGPLTPEQAEKLAEDLAYEALDESPA